MQFEVNWKIAEQSSTTSPTEGFVCLHFIRLIANAFILDFEEIQKECNNGFLEDCALLAMYYTFNHTVRNICSLWFFTVYWGLTSTSSEKTYAILGAKV